MLYQFSSNTLTIKWKFYADSNYSQFGGALELLPNLSKDLVLTAMETLTTRTQNRGTDLNVAFATFPSANTCHLFDLSRNVVVYSVVASDQKTIKRCTLLPAHSILVDYEDETLEFLRLKTSCHMMCNGCYEDFSANKCMFCSSGYFYNSIGCTTACSDMYGGKNSLN